MCSLLGFGVNFTILNLLTYLVLTPDTNNWRTLITSVAQRTARETKLVVLSERGG